MNPYPEDVAALWSEAAEMSVIGGMLLSADAIPRVVEVLADGDFFRESHRRLFRAIVALWQRNVEVEPVSLSDHLTGAGDMEAVGGVAYLGRLWDYVTDASNVEYHAKIILRLSALRSLQLAASAIALEVHSAGNREADEVFGAAERLIAEAAPAVRGRPMALLKDQIWPAMENLERLDSPNEERRLRCGIPAVDDITGGFRRGDLIVVAGRPSMGKSSFGVCNIIGHAAIVERQVCALFSPETNIPDITNRLLASWSRVNLAAAFRRRALNDDDFPRLAAGAGKLNLAALHMDHETRTIDRLRAKLRRLKRDAGEIHVVGVDYLQMMEAPQFGVNRTQEISYISRELKKVAVEFNCVMVALAQLSRKVEERPDKRPMMSDLRDSGTIEQDADGILLLYRPEYYYGPVMTQGKGKDAQKINVEGKAEIIVAKMRDGDTGTAHVAFRKEFTMFEEMEAHECR